MELTEQEEQEAREILNSMDAETVNLIALDKKYDRQWYAEQLRHLRQMDEYFKEVGEVMHIAGRRDAERAVDEQRDRLTQVMSVYEKAIKDLEKGNDAKCSNGY